MMMMMMMIIIIIIIIIIINNRMWQYIYRLVISDKVISHSTKC